MNFNTNIINLDEQISNWNKLKMILINKEINPKRFKGINF